MYNLVWLSALDLNPCIHKQPLKSSVALNSFLRLTVLTHKDTLRFVPAEAAEEETMCFPLNALSPNNMLKFFLKPTLLEKIFY